VRPLASAPSSASHFTICLALHPKIRCEREFAARIDLEIIDMDKFDMTQLSY
jgi:hypothetical protein